jgi:uncharacterized protein YfaS (alpha-2-macroglobulin family)
MKKALIKYGFRIAFLCTFPSGVYAQGIANGLPVEKLYVFTDRNLYIAGEEILFSTFITNNDRKVSDGFSQVVYHELIKPDGTSAAAGKYPADSAFSSGCISIPEEIITGYYYLKSYTKWMRNCSPEHYSYIRLKIINPKNGEILTGNAAEDNTGVVEMQADSLDVRITTDKKVYKPGEEVLLSIAGNPKQGKRLGICLSVIPEGAYDDYLKGSFTPGRQDSMPGEIQYYPETRGISLS